MATLEIPIPAIANTTGSAVFRVRLEGVDYVMTLQWNPRESMWTLNVADASEVSIVDGVALVPTWSLLDLVTDSRKPPGKLLVWQPNGDATYPTLAGLGTDSKLLYYEAAK